MVVQEERRARSHSESFSRAEEMGEAVGVWPPYPEATPLVKGESVRRSEEETT